MSISYPQPLKFHKKIAQLQVDLVKPKEEMEGEKRRVKEGCLFLSLAKPLGDTGRMDWANKINMKLDAVDLVNVLTGMKMKNFPIKLYHKSEAAGSVTTLEVSPGQNAGTFKWFVSKTVGENKNFGQVYLDTKDMYYISVMFESALPVISGWV
jgi:hypothetical protein